MDTFNRYYEYLFTEVADPRIKNWFLMSDPIGIAVILGLYVYGVYVHLPRFMQNKNAYNLKKIIAAYNVFQIVACSGLIYGMLTSGWTTHYIFPCQPTDYSESELALRMLRLCWCTLMLKIVELIETVFFILRKKLNQVSKLHVYHHVTTICMAWTTCKYIGGGMITMAIIINCVVHIFMYTYYLLASLGPTMQNKLKNWKKRLTMLQMIQFFIFIYYGIQVIRFNCKIPRVLLWMYLPNIFVFTGLFWNFYKVNYVKLQKANKRK